MKIKEMKEKGIEFVKENKAAIAVGGSVFVYGVGMYLLGRIGGKKDGVKTCYKLFETEIKMGQLLRKLERGDGNYRFEQFSNRDRLNGNMNNFSEAVKYFADPKNTENVCGMVVLSKEND